MPAIQRSPEVEKLLQHHLADMKKALDTRDERAWLNADLQFHVELYKESRNILALPLVNLMQPLCLRGLAVGHDAWADTWSTHAEMTQAVLERDTEQARHYAHIIVLRGYMDYKRQARTDE